MPKWAIMRALEQAANARRERDYALARKWINYSRAFRKADQLQELYQGGQT